MAFIFCNVTLFILLSLTVTSLGGFPPADIDECAAKMHYCHANTVCVNLPGSYRCDCVTGYVRVDDFSCTGNCWNPGGWGFHTFCADSHRSPKTLHFT